MNRLPDIAHDETVVTIDADVCKGALEVTEVTARVAAAELGARMGTTFPVAPVLVLDTTLLLGKGTRILGPRAWEREKGLTPGGIWKIMGLFSPVGIAVCTGFECFNF